MPYSGIPDRMAAWVATPGGKKKAAKRPRQVRAGELCLTAEGAASAARMRERAAAAKPVEMATAVRHAAWVLKPNNTPEAVMEQKKDSLTVERLAADVGICFADLMGRIQALQALVSALSDAHPNPDVLSTCFARTHPPVRDELSRLDPPAVPHFDLQIEHLRLYVQRRPDSPLQSS